MWRDMFIVGVANRSDTRARERERRGGIGDAEVGDDGGDGKRAKKREE